MRSSRIGSTIAPHPPDILTGGIVAGTDGTITDVFPDSVAYRAGIGPGEKIVAVDDRRCGCC